MIHKFRLLCLSLLTALSVGFSLEANARLVRIQCDRDEDYGYVGYGSLHGSSSLLYYVQGYKEGEDAWWDVQYSAEGFTFQSEMTGDYLCYTSTTDNTAKYMTTSSAINNRCYWELSETNTEGHFAVYSKYSSSYLWNVRSNTTSNTPNLFGCYSSSVVTSNSQFCFYDKEGNLITNLMTGETVEPVDPSDPVSVENIKENVWYTIQIRGNKYWQANASQVDLVTSPSYNDNLLWKFEKQSDGTYCLLNKAFGDTYRMCFDLEALSWDPNKCYMFLSDYYSWYGYTFNLGQSGDYIYFYYNGDKTKVLNDVSDVLKFYASSTASTDYGSMCTIKEYQDGDFSGGGTGGGGTGEIIETYEFDPDLWYTVRIRGTKYWTAQGTTQVDLQTNPDMGDDVRWRFIKQEDGSYKIYNKSIGLDKPLSYPMTSSTAGSSSITNGATATFNATTTGGNRPGKTTYGNTFHIGTYGGKYYVYAISNTCVLNDYSSSNILKFWSDTRAPSDGGSACEFAVFNEEDWHLVETLTLDHTTLNLAEGGTATLNATITPENASNPSLTWTSSNIDVVSVTNGVLHALSSGTAIITVSTNDGSKLSATCSVTVRNQTVGEPEAVLMDEPMLFVYKRNGKLDAIPQRFIQGDVDTEARPLVIQTTFGQTLTYTSAELLRVSTEGPTDLPYFTSFKFNNKFNDQMFTDPAEDGVISEDYSTVHCAGVAQIGKWLVPSFQFSDREADDVAEAYVGLKRQKSKESRQNFAFPVTYTITLPGYKCISYCEIVDEYGNATTEIVRLPYGRQTTVSVEFLADQAVAEGRVPTVTITPVGAWSRSMLDSNKETYREALISFDGAGIYPDMPDTPVLIKGRGNSSWSHSPKPYRLKFDSKQKPFGMTAGKSWNLISNSTVKQSKLTNAVGMKAAGIVGSAGANHMIPIKLIFDGEDRGNYNFTEKVGFSNNSIDIDDESAAALLEMDTYGGEPYTFSYYGSYTLPVNIKAPDFATDAESIVITQYDVENSYRDFLNVLEQGDDSYAERIDIDAFVRYFFVNELAFNCELKHPKSVYLYNENVLDYTSPWVYGPVWDLDWAWGYEVGSATYSVYSNPKVDYLNTGISSSLRNYWRKLRENSEVVKKEYYRLWKHFNDDNLQELLDYVDDYYALASPMLDYAYPDYIDYQSIKEYCKTYLRTRIPYVLNNHLQAYDLSDEIEPEEDEPIYGDVNGDRDVNVADLTCIMDYILGTTHENFSRKQADINADGTISVTDVVRLASYILELPAVRSSYSMPVANAALNLGRFDMEDGVAQMPGTLRIGEDGQYRDVQFDFVLPEGVEIQDVELPATMSDYRVRYAQNADGVWRVVISASAQRALTASDYNLVFTLGANTESEIAENTVSTRNVLISTVEAEAERMTARTIHFDLNGCTTGIHTTTTTGSNGAVIYDLQGRPVQQRVQGVNIQNGKKIVR